LKADLRRDAQLHSVYELLPIYECCDVGNGRPSVVEAAVIPNVDTGVPRRP
jgi:hypothetical protein